jgi:hypothetical protein
MWRNIWGICILLVSFLSVYIGYIYADDFFQLGNGGGIGIFLMKCASALLVFIFSVSILAFIEQFFWTTK